MTDIFLPGAGLVPDDNIPAPAAVRVRTRQRTKVSVAESGRMLSRIHGGQTFEIGLTYNPMLKEQAGPIIAFLQAQQGRNGIFKVKLPQLTGIAGVRLGNFVNFTDSDKLHLITDYTSTNQFSVTPDVIGTPVVDTNGPFVRCSLVGDVQEIRLDRDRLIRLQIDVVERL
ncbi:hypothetical protein KFE96_06710 [Kordiimonas sp. SCSIO 12603]|uniref:hypothetical protein n=1 Tax=Kordiimonas sp. SCSIO 12603 TaxID=2829596 RepID=UPI00210276A5|nr:hypothetical protein [Kordiimonas sp. SCSIO 12603]UTW59992.1 hypothetical protein KFE96_06710 [Kordiimonas sp. SCSIO 12603]